MENKRGLRKVERDLIDQVVTPVYDQVAQDVVPELSRVPVDEVVAAFPSELGAEAAREFMNPARPRSVPRGRRGCRGQVRRPRRGGPPGSTLVAAGPRRGNRRAGAREFPLVDGVSE